MEKLYFGIVINKNYVALRAIEFSTWDERYGACTLMSTMCDAFIEPLYMRYVDVIIDDNYSIKGIEPRGTKLNPSMTLVLKKRLNELGYYIA